MTNPQRPQDPVRGVGSNQHADKPPATTAAPASTTAAGRAAGATADTDPFSGSAPLETVELAATLADLSARINDDGTITIDTNYLEAIEVDVDPTAEEPFAVWLRKWDATGGVAAEVELGSAANVGEATDIIRDAYIDQTREPSISIHTDDNGALHRLDGPARVWEDGVEEWAVHGEKVFPDTHRYRHVTEWGDAEWEAEGFLAAARGEPSASALNRIVNLWLNETDPAVGDPRTRNVMDAFQTGFQKHNDLAADQILEDNSETTTS